MATTRCKASHLMAHDYLATQHKALWLNGFRFIEGRWNNQSGVMLDTDGGGVEHACNSIASDMAQKGKALIDQFLWLEMEWGCLVAKLSHKLNDKLNRHRVQLTECKQRSVLFESGFAILRGEWLRNGAEIANGSVRLPLSDNQVMRFYGLTGAQ